MASVDCQNPGAVDLTDSLNCDTASRATCLSGYLITKHEVMEISVAFAALGALLVALAILLGQVWRPLP